MFHSSLRSSRPLRFERVKRISTDHFHPLYPSHPSSRDAISYCGLCSRLESSAGKSKRGPLRKQRNKHLQWALIEVAKVAPRCNAQLAAVHARKVERGNRNRATLALGLFDERAGRVRALPKALRQGARENQEETLKRNG